jgi:serine/threonine protein kinase
VVALKVLRSSAARSEGALELLFREARIMASVRHPNIVQVFDCGVSEGRAFVAMELVEGRTLEDMIFEDGPFGAERLLPLATQLFSGLDAAHERGVVHRDIKPANLLVQADGTLKILDFGISRAEMEEPGSGVTGRGTWSGTPGFMAPEQYAMGPVDARVDLYAAAVTLYCALTGRTPFPMDLPIGELARRVMQERAPSIQEAAPRIPRTLARAIDRGLARDPDARFPNAKAFRAGLLGDMGNDSSTVGPLAPTALLSPSGPPTLGGTATPVLGSTPVMGLPSPPPIPQGLGFSSAPPSPHALGASVHTAHPPSNVPPSSGISPGWLLAGVGVGALVLVAGAIGGALAMGAHASKDPSPKSAKGVGVPAASSGALKELADHGVYVDPPVLEKSGSFDKTQLCEGPNDLRFVKAKFDVKDGPAVLVTHNCEVELIDCEIRGPVGIRLQHNAVVTVRRGKIVAETAGVDFDGSTLTMFDTQIEAQDGIRQASVGTVKLSKVDIRARSRGYLASSALDTNMEDTRIFAPIGILTGSGHFKIVRGAIESTLTAIEVDGLTDVDLDGTKIQGEIKIKGSLAHVKNGNPQPVAAPLTMGSALVDLPGLMVTVPQTNPEGADLSTFVNVVERAAPALRACKAGKAESVHLILTIQGPELPGRDHRIGAILPNPQGPVGTCVANAFRAKIPDPWLEAGSTRLFMFDVKLK